MAKYRNQLPQLAGSFFITNGGLETTLIYHKKVELPCFASFHVLQNEAECEWMRNYLRTFVEIAQKYNIGYILESAGWRANPDWMRKLGYSDQDVIDVNRKAIELLYDIRNEYETENTPIVINGCIGPRDDGYNPTAVMSADEAQAYHATQIGVISKTNADMITVLTLNYPEEAIGIARAAKEVGVLVVISFTVETDGRLPTGQTLKEAMELVDKATQNTPAYYMVNCAHPSSFAYVLVPEEAWTKRIHGIKGNASKKSYAELNESKELDAGNPVEFAEHNRALLYKLKNLNVFGGCCGTDYRHTEEICKACINIFDQLKGIDHDKIQFKTSTKTA
jgi:S-methylmethionine-dependent homocysteine/selenocysteine methylase